MTIGEFFEVDPDDYQGLDIDEVLENTAILKANGIFTFEEILRKDEQELLAIRGIGKRRLEDIKSDIYFYLDSLPDDDTCDTDDPFFIALRDGYAEISATKDKGNYETAIKIVGDDIGVINAASSILSGIADKPVREKSNLALYCVSNAFNTMSSDQPNLLCGLSVHPLLNDDEKDIDLFNVKNLFPELLEKNKKYAKLLSLSLGDVAPIIKDVSWIILNYLTILNYSEYIIGLNNPWPDDTEEILSSDLKDEFLSSNYGFVDHYKLQFGHDPVDGSELYDSIFEMSEHCISHTDWRPFLPNAYKGTCMIYSFLSRPAYIRDIYKNKVVFSEPSIVFDGFADITALLNNYNNSIISTIFEHVREYNLIRGISDEAGYGF